MSLQRQAQSLARRALPSVHPRRSPRGWLQPCDGNLLASARAGQRRLVHCTTAPFSPSSQLSPSSSADIAKNEIVEDELPRRLPTHHIHSHQRGYGKIVAVPSQPSPSSPVSTFLTDLRHSSPMRLVPSRRSHPTHLQKQPHGKHEAALLHLSSYGGGLVPGDSLHLDIDVGGQGAVVCILTQGGQRIYRPGEHFREHGRYLCQDAEAASPKEASSTLCQSTIQCNIEPGGTLFYLPDPTVPYHQSSFQERREFTCQYATIGEDNVLMGSLIAVDWYSSGRRFSSGMEDERWAFDYLATRTELCIAEQTLHADHRRRSRPDLIESMVFDNKSSNAKHGASTPASIAMGDNLDAMTTMLLHGPTSLSVAKRAKALSHHLAGLCTRTRSERPFENDLDDTCFDGNVDGMARERGEAEEIERLVKGLGGKVLLSVTPTQCNPHFGSQSYTHMARILAESNEDVYRILHHCLKPCAEMLGGLEPYKDRIHSSRTVSKTSLFAKQTNGQKAISHGGRNEDGAKAHHLRRPKSNLHSIANELVFGEHHNDISFCSEDWFRLCTLSDSSLPVGSFAHSLGIEAASQMGIFVLGENDTALAYPGNPTMSSNASSCSARALSDYISSVSRSNARFSTPLILAGYALVAPSLTTMANAPAPSLDAKNVHQSWIDMDAYADALLLSNEPGRRASMDQGLGLLRIAPSFEETDFHQPNDLATPRRETLELWELIRQSIGCHGAESIIAQSDKSSSPTTTANGHAAPIYGILAASLGISPLDACRVFAFGAARDTVSAAVRLNLIGPMEGLSVLDGVGRLAVEEGLEEGLMGMLPASLDGRDGNVWTQEEKLQHWFCSVATCSPVTDTVQPLHDLLSVRLFRT